MDLVRRHNTNTIVNGSCSPNFLKVAVDELENIHDTEKIVDYIKTEQAKIIIGNPPYYSAGRL